MVAQGSIRSPRYIVCLIALHQTFVVPLASSFLLPSSRRDTMTPRCRRVPILEPLPFAYVQGITWRSRSSTFIDASHPYHSLTPRRRENDKLYATTSSSSLYSSRRNRGLEVTREGPTPQRACIV
jgi:hypothetical protein